MVDCDWTCHAPIYECNGDRFCIAQTRIQRVSEQIFWIIIIYFMELRLLCVCDICWMCTCGSFGQCYNYRHIVLLLGWRRTRNCCQKHAHTHTSERILAENDTPNNIGTSLNTHVDGLCFANGIYSHGQWTDTWWSTLKPFSFIWIINLTPGCGLINIDRIWNSHHRFSSTLVGRVDIVIVVARRHHHHRHQQIQRERKSTWCGCPSLVKWQRFIWMEHTHNSLVAESVCVS